jgi:hypothetical protein
VSTSSSDLDLVVVVSHLLRVELPVWRLTSTLVKDAKRMEGLAPNVELQRLPGRSKYWLLLSSAHYNI